MSKVLKLRVHDNNGGSLEFVVRDEEEAKIVAYALREFRGGNVKPLRCEFFEEWSIGPEVSPIRERPGTKIDGIAPSGAPGV